MSTAVHALNAGQVRAPVASTPLASSEEAALVRRAQDGDLDAFDQLVRQHIERALRIARRLMPTPEDAEDVVQDAFLSALRAIASFDLTRPFGPWISRIVVNQGLSRRRAHARRPDEALPAELPSHEPSPLQLTERGEIADRFRAALTELPKQQQLIIQLFEIEGFSSPEIGAMTGLSDGTVRWHIHTARKILRAALAGFSHDGE